MILWSVHSCFHGCKNYKNGPRNARVIVENKAVPFYGTPCTCSGLQWQLVYFDHLWCCVDGYTYPLHFIPDIPVLSFVLCLLSFLTDLDVDETRYITNILVVCILYTASENIPCNFCVNNADSSRPIGIRNFVKRLVWQLGKVGGCLIVGSDDHQKFSQFHCIQIL